MCHRLCTFSIAALVLASMPAAAQQVFRVGTEGAYAPWNMTAPSGKLEGFEIDLGGALCGRMHVTCRFVAQDWEGMFPALHAGRFDAVMSGVNVTGERKRTLAFSRPYAVSPASFLARRDAPLQAAETLEEVRAALRGKRVGVQIGTTNEDFLRQAFGDTIEIVTYDNLDNLRLDLASGRLDAGFSKILTWRDFMASPQGQNFDLFGPALTGADFADFGEGVAIALPLGSAWLARLDEALAGVKADGTLRALSLKWFGTDAYLP